MFVSVLNVCLFSFCLSVCIPLFSSVLWKIIDDYCLPEGYGEGSMNTFSGPNQECAVHCYEPMRYFFLIFWWTYCTNIDLSLMKACYMYLKIRLYAKREKFEVKKRSLMKKIAKSNKKRLPSCNQDKLNNMCVQF